MARSHQLFIKKQVQTDLYKKTGLEKTLTAFSLTTMGIGAIVGAGIFITPGLIAANYAGPGVMLSYLIAVVVCAMAALCYSEFSSTIPLAGSAYTYVYAVFGEFTAWILGWALISEYLFAVSSVAVSWSSYFQSLLAGFGFKLPVFFRAAAGTAGVKGGAIDLVALVITMLVAWLLSKGIRESARINNIMVIVKILVILLFIGIAVFYVKPANYNPFLPFGTAGIFKGAAVAFYAYIGFDAVSTASEEVKNPKRNMPIGIISSLLVAAVLYIGLSAVLVGVVHYTKLSVADPVALALSLIHQNWASGVVSFGAIVGMTTVLIVMSYGGTRLLFAISRDGLLPSGLKKLNPKTHVPVANTWIFGILASLFAAVIPIDKIAELVNIGTLSAFAMVSLGIVFLRHDERFKNLDTSFKVPWYPFLPIASFLACLYLMTQLQAFTWLAFAVWVVLGLIVYMSYGYQHSVVRQQVKG
ncbi:APC family permease [Levilactobacillus yonginensis]|uniref:APC family permease n=1 Tax=Levilactobacillus yonginensis TaxID=1054041 RepID=UPI00345DB5A8